MKTAFFTSNKQLPHTYFVKYIYNINCINEMILKRTFRPKKRENILQKFAFIYNYREKATIKTLARYKAIIDQI